MPSPFLIFSSFPMHTIIHPLKPARRSRSSAAVKAQSFRSPLYDCLSADNTLKIVVYVPGVEASGVEISTRGPDLIVTARKTHFVRVNWQSLHLEPAQRDYQLRLRLGRGLDYSALQAEIQQGTLTLTVPKKQPHASADDNRLRDVA